ncbi:hypothetical protein GIB67_005215 [Kingdonia uniflora]|uniref:Uncharacterized protein n=1 Tax=Kingdonia uniflora TaxID=39325 RepID=A0A7J7NNC8_9MAGN|nr:hypothetical protein GIB67_005215 [Kingdonia uniflora]
MGHERRNGSSRKDGEGTSRRRAFSQHPNAILRAEIDYIRSQTFRLRMETAQIQLENKRMTNVLQHFICPACTTSAVEEQNLIMENAELRKELERVSPIGSSFTQHQPSTSLDFCAHDVIPGETSTNEEAVSNPNVENVNVGEESVATASDHIIG